MSQKNSTHLICFDMDGVLIHSTSVATQIFYDTMEEKFGFDTQTFRQNKKLMSLSAEERFNQLWGKEVKQQGIASDLIVKAIKLYRERRLNAPIPLLPGVKEAVQLVAQHFEFLAVVSGNPESVIQHTLNRLHLRSYFSTLVGIDHVSFAKPHPEMYLKAADYFGIDPKRALTFEDSTHGIASAKGAGMKVIAVATGLESMDELKRTPADAVWGSFLEMDLEKVQRLLLAR